MANHTYCIELIEGDHDYLLSLSKNRTIQAQVVERAKILLQKEAGKPDKSVAEGLCIDVSAVRLCVQKYLEGRTIWLCMTDSAEGDLLKYLRMLLHGL